jgi:hypothetical protein
MLCCELTSNAFCFHLHFQQDTAAYQTFCCNINSGSLIHHNLLGMLDSAEAKQQRYAAAYKLYELAFPPTRIAEIWPAATAAAAAAAAPVTPTASTAAELAAAGGDAEAGSSRKRSAAIALQDDDAVESCSDSASGSALKRAAQGAVAHITISISAGRGEEVLFKTKTSTKMLKIFKAFAAQVNKDCADLKFFGPDMRQIDPNWPVQYVGLTEGDEIDVLYPQQGC